MYNLECLVSFLHEHLHLSLDPEILSVCPKELLVQAVVLYQALTSHNSRKELTERQEV